MLQYIRGSNPFPARVVDLDVSGLCTIEIHQDSPLNPEYVILVRYFDIRVTPRVPPDSLFLASTRFLPCTVPTAR